MEKFIILCKVVEIYACQSRCCKVQVWSFKQCLSVLGLRSAAALTGGRLFIIYITETFVHLTKNWINGTKWDFAAVKLLSIVLHLLRVTIAASTQSTEAEHRAANIDHYSRLRGVK